VPVVVMALAWPKAAATMMIDSPEWIISEA
jgi:hypothetical protein